jgi:hypothetical protein
VCYDKYWMLVPHPHPTYDLCVCVIITLSLVRVSP